jgi:hypothetical protein
MKKICRKRILAIIFVSLALLYITITFISIRNHHFNGFSKTINNEEDDINLKNSYCPAKNLTFSDTIATIYMKGKRGRVECDILRHTYFVQINDHRM